MKESTILLADDHVVVRQGFKALLEESGFSVIGEAGDGMETLRLVERLHPEVLVLDVMMPLLNGLEVTRQVSKKFPRIAVVLLSMYPNEAYVLEGLRNGASAYVVKDSTAADLVTAIREARAGRRYLSPPLTDSAIDSYLEKARGAPLDRYDTLTTREREVLQMAAEGLTNGEISRRLFTSPRTVEAHRAHLMSKLGLRNHSQLVRYALKRGLIVIEP